MSNNNVTLSLGVAAGGALLVWLGIRHPEGGLAGVVQRLASGQPATTSKSASNVLDYAGALYGSGGAGGASSAAGTTGSTGSSSLLDAARKYLGVPYSWGGTTSAGMDCSGLVYRAAADIGVTMPRVAALQMMQGTSIAVAAAAPGDLIGWGAPAHHIGIYAGNGQVLHAPKPGGVVRMESLASISSSLPGSPAFARRLSTPPSSSGSSAPIARPGYPQ